MSVKEGGGCFFMSIANSLVCVVITCILNLVHRASLSPVFDSFWYASMDREGLEDVQMLYNDRQTEGIHRSMGSANVNTFPCNICPAVVRIVYCSIITDGHHVQCFYFLFN